MKCVAIPLVILGILGVPAWGCDKTPTGWTPMAPEKRVIRSSIAVKALVSKTYPVDPDTSGLAGTSGYVAELWLLDVYKGQDKLASGLGLPGHGADAVFHLKDQ